MRRLEWPPSRPSASSSLVVEVEDDARERAARGRRRGPLRPAPGPRRGGRGRVRRRSCRPRGGRASRPARGRPPGRPAPSSWRSARAGCGRSGRHGRRPPPPATPSTGRPRRRRRRRRRTPALRLLPGRLSADRSRPARAARPPPPRGRRPARRRSSPRPRWRGARRPRPASPPPRRGLRSRRAAPRRRRSPAPSPRAPAAAPARSLSRRDSRASAVCSFSFSRSASRARISAVACSFGGLGGLGGLVEAPLCLLDPHALRVASRIGPLIAHRRTNLLRGGQNVAVGLDRAFRRPRGGEPRRPPGAVDPRVGGRPDAAATAAFQASSSNAAQSVPSMPSRMKGAIPTGVERTGTSAGERLDADHPEALVVGGDEDGVGGVDPEPHRGRARSRRR